MELYELVKEHIGSGIVTAITGVITFIVTRKQTITELKKNEGEALKTTQEVYDKLVADMKTKFLELREEVATLSTSLKEIRSNQIQLQRELDDCRKLNNR